MYDWSSAVCVSDRALRAGDSGFGIRDSGFGIRDSSKRERHITCVIPNPPSPIPNRGPQGITGGTYVTVNPRTHSKDRKSVMSGKSVSVRVHLDGSVNIKNNNQKHK